MRRKPCEGRNVEDSDADLYAEYHGNHSNSSNTSMSDNLDPFHGQGQDDRPQPRHRQLSGRKNGEQSALQNKERYENFPDLKSTIDVNFVSMYRQTSTERKNIQSESTVAKDSGQEEIVNKVGYNFEKKFGEVFSEHKKYLQEKRVHDEQRRLYLEIGDEGRTNRSKSWSEGWWLACTCIMWSHLCTSQKLLVFLDIQLQRYANNNKAWLNFAEGF